MGCITLIMPIANYQNWTTILVRKTTRDAIKDKARKSQSYDDFLVENLKLNETE